MQSSLLVTDAAYSVLSVLSTEDVGERIAMLSRDQPIGDALNEDLLTEVLEEALRQIRLAK